MLVDNSFQTYFTMPFPAPDRGSPSPSPPAAAVVTPIGDYNAENSLDDIFGSEPSSPHAEGPATGDVPEFSSRQNEPSDIPRLRSEHSTAGYRDGLGVSKSKYIQEGFDEGYSLGAVIGLRIGAVVGILEGIYAALVVAPRSPAVTTDADSAFGTVHGTETEVARLKTLVKKAKKDLKTEEVFGREWWGENGIWKFDVAGEDEGEVTFNDVADAHPLIKRWEELVATEVQKFSVDVRKFAEPEGED